MLPCKQKGCSWHLVYIVWYQNAADRCTCDLKGTKMSKAASVGLTPGTTLFGRLMASIDRVLMASANAAIRNGDLTYFGL